jgi:hypothetical protein
VNHTDHSPASTVVIQRSGSTLTRYMRKKMANMFDAQQTIIESENCSF